MQKWFNIVLISILALQGSACSTSRAVVDYDKMGSDVKLAANSVEGKNLGTVKGDEGGAIWADCTDKATESVRVMMAKAKDAGANAIGDIKWAATNNSTPSCKKGWGYLVIWPFILTPLFMSTAVEGTMYKTESGSKHSAGLFMIPQDAEGQGKLARQMAGDSL